MHKKLIWIIELYLTITFIFFLFGPIQFPRTNITLVIMYIFLYQVFFYLGFKFGETKLNIYQRLKFKQNNQVNGEILIVILLMISFIFSIINIFSVIGLPTPSNIISAIQNSISNAGEVYNSTLKSSKNASGSTITILITLFSPLSYGIIPYCLYHFKSFSKFIKMTTYIVIIFNMLSYFITGTNLGVFRIILTFVSVLILKLADNNKRAINKKILVYMSVFALLVLFIIIFSNNVSSRMADMTYTINGFSIDFNNGFIRYLPDGLKLTLIFVVFYVSQGYYGFSLALNYPWTPTYFLGGSRFLMTKAEILGVNSMQLFERTYINKMSSLWSPEVNWHTAYTWLANDLSPLGVSLYMFLLGLLLSTALKKAMAKDTISIVLLPILFMIVIFLPMNNNILGNPLTFVPFMTYLIIFLLNNRFTISRKA